MKKKVYRELHKNDEEVKKESIKIIEKLVETAIEEEPKKKTGRKKKND